MFQNTSSMQLHSVVALLQLNCSNCKQRPIVACCFQAKEVQINIGSAIVNSSSQTAKTEVTLINIHVCLDCHVCRCVSPAAVPSVKCVLSLLPRLTSRRLLGQHFTLRHCGSKRQKTPFSPQDGPARGALQGNGYLHGGDKQFAESSPALVTGRLAHRNRCQIRQVERRCGNSRLSREESGSACDEREEEIGFE